MITQFLNNIERAIKSYEKLFTADKPMNAKRADDIIILRHIITTESFEDLDEAINKIKNKIDKFKTGWFIFTTGRSRLKQNIEQVFKHYSQTLVRDLASSIQDFHTVLYDSGNLSLKSFDDLYDETQGKLDMAQKELKILKAKLADLQRENAELKVRLSSLISTPNSESKDSPLLFSRSYT